MTDMSDILESIREAETHCGLWGVTLDHLHARGVTMASYHPRRPDGSAMDIETDGYPEDWVDRYIAEDLVKIDPIPELASRLAEPFFWHDIRTLSARTESTERYLTAMAKAKMGDGLAFCVFGPGLQNAYVGLGFGKARINLDADEIFELQCIAQAAHLRFCVLERQAHPPLSLSDREKEVLNWVARGKSNSIIAQILGISGHTVDAHIRKIYSKLNVSDRTSAALRGIGSGLVQAA